MRSLNTTWRHIRRSPYQAFAAIFIMAQTFFVISVFAFVILGSSKIITYFESVPQVAAFFKETAKQSEIDQLKKKIESTGKTSKLEFISKDQAYKIYREQFKDDPLLLELVSADILPAALRISTYKIDDLSVVSDMLSKSSLVERVVFQKDIVQILANWTGALRQIGVGVTAVLALDAVFIMVIIIGIKISHKRDEIEIVRLLGATNWYVRWPFLLEGVFYGVVGALLGWALAAGMLWYFTPYLSSFLSEIPLLPVSWLLLVELLGLEILLAIILGIFSSFLAVLRYLK